MKMKCQTNTVQLVDIIMTGRQKATGRRFTCQKFFENKIHFTFIYFRTQSQFFITGETYIISNSRKYPKSIFAIGKIGIKALAEVGVEDVIEYEPVNKPSIVNKYRMRQSIYDVKNYRIGFHKLVTFQKEFLLHQKPENGAEI